MVLQKPACHTMIVPYTTYVHAFSIEIHYIPLHHVRFHDINLQYSMVLDSTKFPWYSLWVIVIPPVLPEIAQPASDLKRRSARLTKLAKLPGRGKGTRPEPLRKLSYQQKKSFLQVKSQCFKWSYILCISLHDIYIYIYNYNYIYIYIRKKNIYIITHVFLCCFICFQFPFCT